MDEIEHPTVIAHMPQAPLLPPRRLPPPPPPKKRPAPVPPPHPPMPPAVSKRHEKPSNESENINMNVNDENNSFWSSLSTAEQMMFKELGYKPIGKLGEGSYSMVYELEGKKALKVSMLSRKYVQEQGIPAPFITELDILSRSDHPNISDAESPRVTKLTENTTAITYVMPKASMDLHQFLYKKHKNPTLKNRNNFASIMHGILAGVHALHHNHIIHRDLKPSNILLVPGEDCLVPIVTDFNLAVQFCINETQRPSKKSTHVGTPFYQAPEIVSEIPTYDKSSDMWSLGLILLEMVRDFPGCSKYWSQGVSGSTILTCYNEVLGPIPKEVKSDYIRQLTTNPPQSHTHKNIKDFLIDGAYENRRNPSYNIKTLSGETLLISQKADWIKSDPKSYERFEHLFTSEQRSLIFDLISRCLQFDPQKRITAEEALFHPLWSSIIPAYNPNYYLDASAHAFCPRERLPGKMTNEILGLGKELVNIRGNIAKKIYTLSSPLFTWEDDGMRSIWIPVLALDLADRALIRTIQESLINPEALSLDSVIEVYSDVHTVNFYSCAALRIALKLSECNKNIDEDDEIISDLETTICRALEFTLFPRTVVQECEAELTMTDYTEEQVKYLQSKLMQSILVHPDQSPLHFTPEKCLKLFK